MYCVGNDMRAALIHDKKVINIIYIDNAAIDSDVLRFDKETKIYKKDLAQYKKNKKKYQDNYLKYKDKKEDYELSAFDIKIKLTGQERKDALSKLVMPKPPIDNLMEPKKPRPALGLYNPPEGHELIYLDENQECNIGWIWTGKGFDDPTTIANEAKTFVFGGFMKKIFRGEK